MSRIIAKSATPAEGKRYVCRECGEGVHHGGCFTIYSANTTVQDEKLYHWVGNLPCGPVVEADAEGTP
jgi:hypothetical protein